MLNLRALVTALVLAAVLSPAANAAYSDKTFTLTNTGNGSLTVTGAAISGNTAEFSLAGNTCTSISTGGSCTLTARFTPSGSGTRNPASLTVTSNGTNGPTHSVALSGSGGASCTAGKQIYSYTGGDQNIAVPVGCSSATIKAWGAGGRAGAWWGAGYPAVLGGGGGFSLRTVSGLTPGSTLTVVVGQGATGIAATYGGGGAGRGVSVDPGGAGGGLSGVFAGAKAQANALALAGGGGGGGPASAGGPGGGSSGGTPAAFTDEYDAVYSGGGGGTPASGGAGGDAAGLRGTAGGALQGGYLNFSYADGSGGGGGYWGGGGAAYQAGGGGSGYAPGGTLVAGSGCSVANSTDPDYAAGIGKGGCSANTSGQNGRVVIIWQ